MLLAREEGGGAMSTPSRFHQEAIIEAIERPFIKRLSKRPSRGHQEAN